MLKRFGLTFLLTTLGAIVGLALAIAFVWDWFTSDWVRLEASPEPIAELLHIEQDQVWVESESGQLYKYYDAENCTSDCWTLVNSPPTPVWHDDPDLMEIKNETCSPPKPSFATTEMSIAQCRVETWVSRNYVFTLREKGDLYFWQGDVFGEWLVVELMLGLGGGATCLCIPSALFILLPGLLRRKAKEN